MSDFSGYEKMPNSLKKIGLKPDDFSKMEKLQWVVTEKIHGANFSFVYEEGILKYAKRKAYLSWEDDFFGFQLVVHQIENQIIRLFEQLSHQIDASKYIIYGELMGGNYPHPDVIQNPNLQAIQTGVYYSPDIHFCAFDIAIIANEDEAKYYLDYETALSLFQEHSIFHAQALSIDKLSEVLNFDTRINSTIPQQLNLPTLKDNLIEGIVIKPYNQSGDYHIFTRPILKLKNPEFDEENKFHNAEKWTYIPNVSSKTEDLSFILEELRNYITPNKLDSAISKIGALDFNNQSRIADIKKECLHDSFIDFNENNQQLLKELSPEEREWLEERILSDIHQLIINSK